MSKIKTPSFNTMRYGILVEVMSDPEHGWSGGYHTGMRVHFFNKNGVLVGNIYKFLPYEQIRFRTGEDRQYPRLFMDQRLESIKQWTYERLCVLVTRLIELTQTIGRQ